MAHLLTEYELAALALRVQREPVYSTYADCSQAVADRRALLDHLAALMLAGDLALEAIAGRQMDLPALRRSLQDAAAEADDDRLLTEYELAALALRVQREPVSTYADCSQAVADRRALLDHLAALMLAGELALEAIAGRQMDLPALRRSLQDAAAEAGDDPPADD
jgi:hypothetical protein